MVTLRVKLVVLQVSDRSSEAVATSIATTQDPGDLASSPQIWYHGLKLTYDTNIDK